MDYPPLRIVRFSGPALTEGIEANMIDGVPVRITGVAKTVADCVPLAPVAQGVSCRCLHRSILSRIGASDKAGQFTTPTNRGLVRPTALPWERHFSSWDTSKWNCAEYVSQQRDEPPA